MLDLNGNPIQLHRWYWVRRKGGLSGREIAVWVTAIHDQQVIASQESNSVYTTGFRPSWEYQFLPAMPPEWPEYYRRDDETVCSAKVTRGSV
jgi:hypothetical protein